MSPQKQNTLISSVECGIHKRADGAFTASKQHGHPKGMPLDLDKPPHPPSHFVHNTQVNITSSEASQNRELLGLEANTRPKVHGQEKAEALHISRTDRYRPNMLQGLERGEMHEDKKTFPPSAPKKCSPSTQGTKVNCGSLFSHA